MNKNIINDGCVLVNQSSAINVYKNILLATMLLFLVFSVSCNKEPEYIPGLEVQGIRAPISKVLFSPVAYDGAVLKLEGVVAGLVVEGQIDETLDVSVDKTLDEPTDTQVTEEEEADIEIKEPTTLFKLVDTKGNYINIIMPGVWEFVDTDYLVVGGIYRKDGNELEAREYELVEFEEDEREQQIEDRDDW